MRWAPACQSLSTIQPVASDPKPGKIQSSSPFGPPAKPSSDICICRMSLRISTSSAIGTGRHERCARLGGAGVLALVLVVAPPPFVRRGLRPSFGRALPCLLPAVGREIQQRPHAAEPLHPARGGEIGAEHAGAVAQEDAEAVLLAVLRLVRLRLPGADA